MALADARLTAVDRAFAGHLAERIARIRADWESLAFHRAVDGLLQVCTVDLSAVFLDVSKDRLYTLAPDDPARRSAQTVLWRALHDLVIAASPALAFTAEEAWQAHPGPRRRERERAPRGVARARESASGDDWRLLVAIRDAVNAALEPRRASKELATTAEAEVTIRVSPATATQLAPWAAELAGFLIVARADVVADPAATEPAIDARRTDRARCDRCWTHREDVVREGEAALCGRCRAVLAGLPGPAAS